ncbi:MAG: hypothetical protein ACLUFV_11280 [Acutalibacteraceae bacterium]
MISRPATSGRTSAPSRVKSKKNAPPMMIAQKPLRSSRSRTRGGLSQPSSL